MHPLPRNNSGQYKVTVRSILGLVTSANRGDTLLMMHRQTTGQQWKVPAAPDTIVCTYVKN